MISNTKRCSFLLTVALASLHCCCLASAADHRVEKLASKAPEGLAPAIAATLAPEGIQVIRGTSRVVCEVWLCKQWQMKSLEAKGDVDYAFTPGQLIGVVNYPRKGADFRDQEIEKGLYTLRYAQQPVDGAHVGTSPTRDFLLLVRAEADKSADLMAYTPLTQASAKAAQTAHPALLSLREPGDKGKAPSLRHDEDRDWWIVRLDGKGKTEDKESALPIELVVVGQASE